MYKLILATRYLLKRPITYFAILAVALCVSMVVVVMTVMTGLVTDFTQKNHSFTGDCVVGTESLVGYPYYEDFMNVLENSDFIQAVSPVIKSYSLLTLRDKDFNLGVEIMGIDPIRHSQATDFEKTLHYRKNDASKAFSPSYDINLPGCVLGIDILMERDSKSGYPYPSSPYELAFSITCFPLTAKGALAKVGAGLVNTQTFYYSDTSHSGLARVDGSTVYLPFEQAQLLCGMAGSIKRANCLHIKFKPNVKLQEGCEKVSSLWQAFLQQKKGSAQADLLAAVNVQSWKDYRRAFIAAMEKEQAMMIVMFGFVGITTVFIVFVVFYMITEAKRKDIGILKSIGASNADVIELFSLFSFMVGLLGACIGIVGGSLFLLKINKIENWLFDHFQFQLWDRTIYAIGDIPNRLDPMVLLIITCSAIVACQLGALLPTWQAAASRPVETLRVSRL
jgi:ABC-type lipoprotein release transport system permease subunit